MTATIINFPKREIKVGYKIPLYTDEEISVTVAAMNVFCPMKNRISEDELSYFDPVVVMDSLLKAKASEIFSGVSKRVINNILNSIEKIELKG